MNPFLDLFKAAWNNPVAKLAIVLLVGILIGSVFKSSKHVEETVSKKYEQQIQTLNESHSKEMLNTQEQLQKVTSESAAYHSETESKITQLTTQVSNLQSKKKTSYYKIVHPDGTVEVRENTEQDTDESNSVVSQVQSEIQSKLDEQKQQLTKESDDKMSQMTQQWSTKEQQYQKTISDYESKKIVDTNAKTTGLELGLMNDKDYYVHATHDLWGPIFLGGQVEMGSGGDRIGVGLGFRF